MISWASSMPARVSRKRHLIIDQPPGFAERFQFGAELGPDIHAVPAPYLLDRDPVRKAQPREQRVLHPLARRHLPRFGDQRRRRRVTAST